MVIAFVGNCAFLQFISAAICGETPERNRFKFGKIEGKCSHGCKFSLGKGSELWTEEILGGLAIYFFSISNLQVSNPSRIHKQMMILPLLCKISSRRAHTLHVHVYKLFFLVEWTNSINFYCEMRQSNAIGAILFYCVWDCEIDLRNIFFQKK